MEYTKEEELRAAIRDVCYYNGAGRIAVTYADVIMEIPQVKAAPDMAEALEAVLVDAHNSSYTSLIRPTRSLIEKALAKWAESSEGNLAQENKED